jgi:hypothetical protein
MLARFERFPTADAEMQTCLAAPWRYLSCRGLCREGGSSFLEAFTRLSGLRADRVTIEDADTFRRVFEIGKPMIDPELKVLHTGRRAHQVGWPRSIVTWFRLQPIIRQRMEGNSLISDMGFRRISEDSRLRFTSRYPACASSSEAVSDETATCRAKSSWALPEGLCD